MKTDTGLTLELVTGNIVEQRDVDAIVNAANAELRIGGGVAGAIHRAAGPGLGQETRALSPISPGEAVITGGHALPNAHVIHCLGPVYGVDEPSDRLLAACYRNTLGLAARNGIRSIAFPAISTGAFGYPIEEAARVALAAILDAHTSESPVELVRLVLFSGPDREVHERALAELVRER